MQSEYLQVKRIVITALCC